MLKSMRAECSLQWPVLLVLTCLSGAAASAPIEVRAAFEPSTQSLTLDYCRPAAGSGPIVLRAIDALATQWLARTEPTADRHGWRLRWPADTPCAGLEFPLGQIAGQRKNHIGWALGPDLLTWSWTWWYQPVAQSRVRLRVELPPGWHFSAPWPQCPGQDVHCFLLGETPMSWPSLAVIGTSPPQRVQIGSSHIDATVLGELTPADRRKFAQLPALAADYIRNAYGRLPVPRLQLLVIPVMSRPGTDAVVFGQLNRGGLGGIQLLVNTAAPARAFADDWVLPHELSHLLHPYLGESRGRWLSEGLASYYQNLLRARAGRLSQAQAWEKLLAGFDRGRAQRSDQPLDELAAQMHENHAYMRIYWSGAAFWLKVDLALRQSGHPGLDQLLARFGEAHLPAAREWTATEFLSALDRQLDTPLLTPLAEQLGQSSDFPELSEELSDLGLDWQEGKLQLRAAGAGWREAITRAR